MNKNSLNDNWATAVSIGVFLFFALMLSVPSGYSYGAAWLFISSLIFLAKHPLLNLSYEDKSIVCILLSIFAISFAIFLVHGNEIKTLDQTSRNLLAIPILLMLLQTPPRLPYLWMGLMTGGVLTAGITLWQRYWLDINRATGFVTSAIPFGDISLTMATLCAAGLFWVATKGQHAGRWRIALYIGFLTNFYSFVESETRGGWLAVPPTVLLFCIALSNTKKNLKRAVVIGTALTVTLGVIFIAAPNTGVKARYEIAIFQMETYIQTHESETSVGARLEAWRSALINIPKRPLLGWSHKDYKAQLEVLASEKEIDPYITELANTHNNYLEVWLFQGVFGLIALLALYLFPFWFFYKRLRSPNITVQSLAVGGTSLLISFFIFGMTQVILGRNNGIIFFVLTLVILWTCMRNEEKKFAEERLTSMAKGNLNV